MGKRYVEIEEEDVMVTERAPKYSPCGHGKPQPHKNCKDEVKELIEQVAAVQKQVAGILEVLVCELKDAHDFDKIEKLLEKFGEFLKKLADLEEALADKIKQACDCDVCNDHDYK